MLRARVDEVVPTPSRAVRTAGARQRPFRPPHHSPEPSRPRARDLCSVHPGTNPLQVPCPATQRGKSLLRSSSADCGT